MHNMQYAQKARPTLRMADGGMFGAVKSLFSSAPPETMTQKFARQDAERAAKAGLVVVQPEPAATPAPQGLLEAAKSYGAGSMTEKRMKAAGLRDGGDLRTGAGGHVPGSGAGDKVPAKYEPGEFVVSNAMLDAAPQLREQLHSLRNNVLAHKGMTPEQADAKALGGHGLRAATGFGVAPYVPPYEPNFTMPPETRQPPVYNGRVAPYTNPDFTMPGASGVVGGDAPQPKKFDTSRASTSFPKDRFVTAGSGYKMPAVDPATGGYTGSPSGVPNGQTAGTQNFTPNATNGGARNPIAGASAAVRDPVPPVQVMGVQSANSSVPRTESLKRTLLRDAFGSKEAWGNSTGAIKDSWAKSGYQPTPAAEGPAKPVGRLAKAGGVLGGISGGLAVAGDISEGKYGDAALHGLDGAAALALMTPAAPAAGVYLGARGVYSAADRMLSDNAKDTIGSAVNTGVRSLGKAFGQDWGADDSAYLAQKAETSLRSPQVSAPRAAAPATQNNPNDPYAAANAAKLAAATPVPQGSQISTPTNTLRGQSGTDMGGGITKFTQNGKTLYSNVQGGDNDRLMSRGPTSAQNQGAMDGIQARQDQGDAAYAAKRQVESEIADAQALRKGPTYINSAKLQNERRGQDINREVALRGQTLNYDATVSGHNMTRNGNIARLNYDMQKDKRDFDISRSDYANTRDDKNFEKRQSATKALHEEIGNMLPPGADGKPDLANAAKYATGLTAHVAGVADSYRKRAAAEPNNPQAKDWLDTAAHLDNQGAAALDATAKQRLMAGMMAKDTQTDSHSNWNPFGGTAVQTNAPITSLKLRPGVFSDEYLSTHADGSKGVIPRRKIDGGLFEPANHQYDSLKVK